MLGFLIQFPGVPVFLNYSVLIFEKIGASEIDANFSSIMLAIAQIFGGLFASQLADTLGRKLLMFISFSGSAVALFILTLYLYLNQNGYDLTNYSWLPVSSLSFIMFIASAGVLSLFSVCFVESLPTKVQQFQFILWKTLSNTNNFSAFFRFARLDWQFVCCFCMHRDSYLLSCFRFWCCRLAYMDVLRYLWVVLLQAQFLYFLR